MPTGPLPKWPGAVQPGMRDNSQCSSLPYMVMPMLMLTVLHCASDMAMLPTPPHSSVPKRAEGSA